MLVMKHIWLLVNQIWFSMSTVCRTLLTFTIYGSMLDELFNCSLSVVHVSWELIDFSFKFSIKFHLAYGGATNLDKFCRKNEKVTSKCLEEARKCFGTDEDLLLVIQPSLNLLLHIFLEWNDNLLSQPQDFGFTIVWSHFYLFSYILCIHISPSITPY